MTDEDLVPFRIAVPRDNIGRLTPETAERLSRFLAGKPDVVMWDDYAKDATVAVGKLPQPKVTALQALAMGHDVDAVLDMLESRS